MRMLRKGSTGSVWKVDNKNCCFKPFCSTTEDACVSVSDAGNPTASNGEEEEKEEEEEEE